MSARTTPNRRVGALPVGALLLALLLPACSSTAARDSSPPRANSSAATTAAQDPAEAATVTGTGGTTTEGAAPDGGPGLDRGAEPQPPAGAVAAAQQPGPRPAPGTGPRGTRGAAGELAIGLAVDDAAYNQLYNAGLDIDRGDPIRAAEVAAQVLNSRGGISGRRIRLVPYRHQDNNTDYATAVCARFTEDERVFTVLEFGAAGPGTRKCFGDRGMPVIDAAGSAITESESSPDHYGIASMTLDRLARTMVDRLAARGFFAEGRRIGVVTFDSDRYRKIIDRVLVPRLRKHNRTVTSFAYLKGGLDPVTAQQATNAVTEFQQKGVELVLIFEGVSGTSGPFTHAAAGQQANFDYGLASPSHPSAQARKNKYLVHEDALRRATILGWSPLSDLRYSQGGVRELPPAAQEWRRILASRGLTYPDECCSLGAALVFVDKLRFLQAAFAAAPGSAVSSERLRAGVANLGSGYQSVLTSRTEFGPGRKDGVAGIRYATWDTSCECVQYVSDVIPLRHER
jgi:hypothetical protein